MQGAALTTLLFPSLPGFACSKCGKRVDRPKRTEFGSAGRGVVYYCGCGGKLVPAGTTKGVK